MAPARTRPIVSICVLFSATKPSKAFAANRIHALSLTPPKTFHLYTCTQPISQTMSECTLIPGAFLVRVAQPKSCRSSKFEQLAADDISQFGMPYVADKPAGRSVGSDRIRCACLAHAAQIY